VRTHVEVQAAAAAAAAGIAVAAPEYYAPCPHIDESAAHSL